MSSCHLGYGRTKPQCYSGLHLRGHTTALLPCALNIYEEDKRAEKLLPVGLGDCD